MCTAPECYMSEHAPRPQRSCVRCGRRGRNAFRRIMVEGLEGGWLCSHEATCVSRARLRARRRLKDPSTDERALPLFVKPVAVMGRDPRGVALIEQILTEFVGVDATHGRLSGKPDPDAPEVQLRVGVRAREKAPVERFTRELAPLVLTGPPSVTGFAGGRPAVEEVVAYWPALIDRREIEQDVRVEILTA